MRLKTFTAPDIHQAMEQVRETLGEDAVIISTTRDSGNKQVSVTAAIENDEPLELTEDFSVSASASHAYAEEPFAGLHSEEAKVLTEIKSILAYHSVPAAVTDQLLDTAQMIPFEPDTTYEGLRKTLARLLESCFSFMPLPLQRSGFRAMLVGPPGVGKTMTIAKMAAQMVMDKQQVTVITTDTKRAGGIEQLHAFTDILNLDLKVADGREELKKLLQTIGKDERVLVDSAGTNPYNKDELREVSDLLGLGGIEPILTIPAGGDAEEAADIAKAFRFTQARRILFTRVDVSRRYGSILSAVNSGNYAFCNRSSSARVVGEFETMQAGTLSDMLLQYRLEQ
jgi:flagellar biosynthesis protein FlhF